MNEIIVYSKPNCHLCEEALEQIELARAEVSFTLQTVNILSDLELYQRYKHDIPVVTVNGVERFRHRLLADDLVALLRSVPG